MGFFMFLIPLNSDPLQTQNFTHQGYDLTLTTRWNSVVGFWNIDLFDNINQIYLTQSEPLTVGSPTGVHLQLPFVFVLIDEFGIGEGPININELGERLNLYIVNKDTYNAAIRQSNTVNYR